MNHSKAVEQRHYAKLDRVKEWEKLPTEELAPLAVRCLLEIANRRNLFNKKTKAGVKKALEDITDRQCTSILHTLSEIMAT